MNIETASKNVRTTYEAVNADAIPDQQNENMLKMGYFLKDPVLQLLKMLEQLMK